MSFIPVRVLSSEAIMKKTFVCLALLLSFPLMAEAQGRRRRGDGGPKVGARD